MKYQVLFSLKNNKKVFINVCCSCEWLTELTLQKCTIKKIICHNKHIPASSPYVSSNDVKVDLEHSF